MPIHPNARQCAHTKVDGTRCGGPCKDDFEYCFHHHGLKDRLERQRFTIPALDDQNAIQVAVMEIMNALITGKVSRSDAYALFYGLYIAKANLRGLTLVPPTPDELKAMIEKARQEGFEAARKQFERTDADKAEEEESLASLLLRELNGSIAAAKAANTANTASNKDTHSADSIATPDWPRETGA